MNLYEDRYRFLNYNLKKYNWRLVMLVILSTGFGLMVIESAANGYARKQLLGIIIGFITMTIVSFIDYQFVLKFQWVIYFTAVIMLV